MLGCGYVVVALVALALSALAFHAAILLDGWIWG